MVPITFCTPPDGCTRNGCTLQGCVTDENPRSCSDLFSEAEQLVDAVNPAIAEACALTDILISADPTMEAVDAAGEMAIALFLCGRVLAATLDLLEGRHPDAPSDLRLRRALTAVDNGQRQLVDALLAYATRLAA